MKNYLSLLFVILFLSLPGLVNSQGQKDCRNECVDCCYRDLNAHANETMIEFATDVTSCAGFTSDPSFYNDMFHTYTTQGEDLWAYYGSMDTMREALNCITRATQRKDYILDNYLESMSRCMDLCGCNGWNT